MAWRRATITVFALLPALALGGCSNAPEPAEPAPEVHCTAACGCGNAESDLLGCTAPCCVDAGAPCDNARCICAPIEAGSGGERP